MTLTDFIKAHSDQIEAIETASQLAWWNLSTTGESQYAQKLTEMKIALRTLYASKNAYAYLLSQPTSEDPLVHRQVTLMLHQYRENQIPPETIALISQLETEVEATYTNFRPVVDGRTLSNNDLKKILVESLDTTERQKVWEASKAIGEKVESDVLKLIALRNASARSAGFPDFYSMRLELQELDQTRLFELLNELEDLSTPYWERYKEQLDRGLAGRFHVDVSDLMPWHYQDPFFQEAPSQGLNLDAFYAGKDLVAIARAFYEAIGLPAEDILQNSDLYEREKKNQHAFCICIDRKQDIRMLCNMRDNEYWMGTLLHELGHGVYDKYIDQKLPYLLRNYAHISTTEASAMLFGRFGRNGSFLNQYVGVDRQRAEEIDGAARQQTAASLLVFARWALVMIHFERAMYQQPGVDLNRFWWDCVERFQWVKRPQGRNKPDWASKLHLACAPAYYQNYVLGELTASQLFHHLEQQLAARDEEFCTSPLVGRSLRKNLFHIGAQLPWEQALHHATGENLNPKYFALDLQQV